MGEWKVGADLLGRCLGIAVLIYLYRKEEGDRFLPQ